MARKQKKKVAPKRKAKKKTTRPKLQAAPKEEDLELGLELDENEVPGEVYVAKLKSVPNGYLGAYIIFESLGSNAEGLSIKDPIRAFEFLQTSNQPKGDGSFVPVESRRWVFWSDDYFTKFEGTLRFDAIEMFRELKADEDFYTGYTAGVDSFYEAEFKKEEMEKARKAELEAQSKLANRATRRKGPAPIPAQQ